MALATFNGGRYNVFLYNEHGLVDVEEPPLTEGGGAFGPAPLGLQEAPGRKKRKRPKPELPLPEREPAPALLERLAERQGRPAPIRAPAPAELELTPAERELLERPALAREPGLDDEFLELMMLFDL